MHFHVEVWLPHKPPNRDSAEATVGHIIDKFHEDYWDWWVIGGRWTGAHDNYDPTKDPINMEQCTICHGTGDRPGWVEYVNGVRTFTNDTVSISSTGSSADWSRDCNGCNGCQGTGRVVKYQVAPHDEDIMPVTRLNPKMGAAAVVVNRQWIELEENQTVLSVLKEYLRTDCTKGYLVTVDCHN